ncbi:MAG: DNA-3-methyladenine glycosylase [Ferruginibacter sp.]
MLTLQTEMKKLPIGFYDRKDVVQIARELLGKIVQTRIDGKITSGRIVESEAYVGLTDKASHSFGGKRTQSERTHVCRTGYCVYLYLLWYAPDAECGHQ